MDSTYTALKEKLVIDEKQLINSGFYDWIVERHEMYRRRVGELAPFTPITSVNHTVPSSQRAPWTDDPILQKYKFTNPFRENDAVTIWMRENFRPKTEEKATQQNNIINAALFRMVGTIEFAEEFLEQHGWITAHHFDPKKIKQIIQSRIGRKQKCFTGAYIVTNQGIKAPKSQVVIDNFITPLWESMQPPRQFPLGDTVNHITGNPFTSCRALHSELSKFRGFGGGGFMAYEVVCDLLHTPTYTTPKEILSNVRGLSGRSRGEARLINPTDYVVDRYSWANAGPGALRGLNRIWKEDLKKRHAPKEALFKMRYLLSSKYMLHEIAHKRGYKPIAFGDVDMRCIEHSLCEFDKYMRVKENQGRPRSICKYKVGGVYPIKRGPVE